MIDPEHPPRAGLIMCDPVRQPVFRAFRRLVFLIVVKSGKIGQLIYDHLSPCKIEIDKTGKVLPGVHQHIGEVFVSLENAAGQFSIDGFEFFPDTQKWNSALDQEFSEFLKGDRKTFSDPEALSGYLL